MNFILKWFFISLLFCSSLFSVTPNLVPIVVDNITIFVPLPTSMSLGEDRVITKGESTLLTANINSTNEIINYIWKENGTLLGTSSTLDVSTLSAGTHTIILNIIDSVGVNAIDTIDIIIIEQTNKSRFIVTPIFGTSDRVAFGVKLTEKPDANVTLAYASEDITIAEINTTELTFTPDNWYEYKTIIVNILDRNVSTSVTFEPSSSADIRYDNKDINSVYISSHQLLLYKPYDTILYSEYKMSLPINIAYVGEYESNITVTLNIAPDNMTFDKDTFSLIWTPYLSDEGEDVPIEISVSDGIISTNLDFVVHVAETRELSYTISNNELVVTDTNTSLNGLRVLLNNVNKLSNYKLYGIVPEDVPAYNNGESTIAETLLVKGNVGATSQIVLPLLNLVEIEELTSFRVKRYLGEGLWRSISRDDSFVGNKNNPIYILNTSNFSGVISFTKVKIVASMASEKKSNSHKQHKLKEGVECHGRIIYDLLDVNKQICTFVGKDNFTLTIYDYTKSAMYPDFDVEDVAGWIKDTQPYLDGLHMRYFPKLTILFQKFNKKFSDAYGFAVPWRLTDTKWINTFSMDYLFKNISVLDVGDIVLNPLYQALHLEATTKHEYFHHSQYNMKGNYDYNKSTPIKWLYESTAHWFENYTNGNDFKVYKEYLKDGKYYSILEEGLNQTIPQRSPRYPLYAKALFFEMLKNKCTDFIENMHKFFQYSYSGDPDGFYSLVHDSSALQCDFGTPSGENNKNTLSIKLLYYQYISAIKKDISILDVNISKNAIDFPDTLVIKKDTWSRNEQKVNIYKKWKDSVGQTIKIESINRDLSECEMGYLRFKSEDVIMISIASDDSNFPNDINKKLGTMYQSNTNTRGDYTYTHFIRGVNAKAIAPEVYVTIIDVVNGSNADKIQNVEMYYGITNTKMVEYINNKILCSGNMDPLSNTTAVIGGTIPYHHSHNSGITQYIDKIKITDVNSGDVYIANVNADGSWIKSIHFTFNGLYTGSVAPVKIDGYNSANPDVIIQNEVLLITHI